MYAAMYVASTCQCVSVGMCVCVICFATAFVRTHTRRVRTHTHARKYAKTNDHTTTSTEYSSCATELMEIYAHQYNIS